MFYSFHRKIYHFATYILKLLLNSKHLILWVLIVALWLSQYFGIWLYKVIFKTCLWLLKTSLGNNWLKKIHPEFLQFLKKINYAGADIPHRLALYYLGEMFLLGYKKAPYRWFLRPILLNTYSQLMEYDTPIECNPSIYAFSHQTMTKFGILFIENTIEISMIGRNSQEERHEIEKHGTRDFIYARQLMKSQQCLQKGQSIGILSDGKDYKQGLQLPFLGRIQSFAKGFATLALMAKVSVIPIFVLLNSDGTITIKFRSAMDLDESITNNQQMIINYVVQYVTSLEEICRTHPESIMKKHIKNFLNLSKVNDTHKPVSLTP